MAVLPQEVAFGAPHGMSDAPFWYWDVVMKKLYRPDRGMTNEEIRAAIAYMERHDMPVNQQRLSRLLGVYQVFRKRKYDDSKSTPLYTPIF